MVEAGGELKPQSIGPASLTLFGTEVPILPTALGILGLLLARAIAPPPPRQLSRVQQVSLTALLMIVLFLIVTGAFTGLPLEAGMAVVWGIGLGFSGLVSIEFMGVRAMVTLRAMLGTTASPTDNAPSERLAALEKLAMSIPDDRASDQ